MSISDELMARYYRLASWTPLRPDAASAGSKEAARVRDRANLSLAPPLLRKRWTSGMLVSARSDFEHADLPAFSAAQGSGQSAVTIVSKRLSWKLSSLKNHAAEARD